jgi:DNA-binding NtrC family response regulator
VGLHRDSPSVLPAKAPDEFGGMLSRMPELHRVFASIRLISATAVTVVLEGGTGTGVAGEAAYIILYVERTWEIPADNS